MMVGILIPSNCQMGLVVQHNPTSGVVAAFLYKSLVAFR